MVDVVGVPREVWLGAERLGKLAYTILCHVALGISGVLLSLRPGR